MSYARVFVSPDLELKLYAYFQDVYRAEWAWLILMAPERAPGMITSMLADYKEVNAYLCPNPVSSMLSCSQRVDGYQCGRTL